MTKKTWNALSKRGLALFLALVMCMGMLPLSVFAEEAGNDAAAAENVEIVDVTEDTALPTEDQDAQEEEIQQPAEDTEPETPDEETKDEVETPDEETKDEVEAPDEETKDEVETPNEETKDEVETPDEETKDEVETPDVETKDEVPAPPANLDSVTAPIVDAVEEAIAGVVEAPFIPAEVQAFLDAVDAIPEITPENAAEVAEYVYGEVAGRYEALLGTEYEERQDVQEAVAVYTAAVEAIDAALNMESDDFYIPSNKQVHTVYVPSTGLTDDQAELEFVMSFTGYGNLPVAAPTVTNNNPDVATVTAKATDKDYSWNPAATTKIVVNVVGLKATSAPVTATVTYKYQRPVFNIYNQPTGKWQVITQTETLKINVYDIPDATEIKPNESTSFSLKCYPDEFDASEFWANKGISARRNGNTITVTAGAEEKQDLKVHMRYGYYTSIPNGGQITQYVDVRKYTVKADSIPTVPDAPTAPGRDDLYKILGNFVKVVCTSDPVEPGTSTPQHTKDDEKLYNTWTGNLNGKYESVVGSVYQDGDTYKVDVTLNGDVYAKMYSLEPVFGTGVEHTLASDEDATKTITLKWDASNKKWVEASGQSKGTVLATFHVACKTTAATYTVIYKDGEGGEVFGDETYGKLTVGMDTPEFSGKPEREGYTFQGWKLTSVAPNKDGVQPKIAAADANAENQIIYTATWKSKVTPCDFVLVYHEKQSTDTDVTPVTNMPTPNPDVQFEKVTDRTKTLTISSTVPQRDGYLFVAWEWGRDETARFQPGGKITLTAATDNTNKVTADLYAVWKKAAPPVKAPDAPTAQEVNRLVRGSNESAVLVNCESGRHQTNESKFDCWNDEGVPHPYHADRIEIGKVQGNANDGYTCAVTFLAAKYEEAYTDLKNKEHTLVDGETNVVVNFKWNATAKAWELAAGQTTPVRFKVECAQTYTLTYDANGGTGAPSAETKTSAAKSVDFTVSNTEPTKAGYAFKGWSDTADGAVKYKRGGTVTLTETDPKKPVTKTIYAVWEIDNATASIAVEKTIEKQIVSADGEIGWTENVGTLKDGDIVRYTVEVKNTGKHDLVNLQLFDDMDEKLADVSHVQISKEWHATYNYYPAEGNLKPLLFIDVTDRFEVNEIFKVQYQATVQGADGTQVVNTVNAYADIAQASAALYRTIMALAGSVSNGATAGAPSDNMTDVQPGEGGTERPTPDGSVSGGGGTSTDTEQTKFTLTIVCKDEKGNVIQTSTKEIVKGQSYNETAPTIPGYTVTGNATQSGTMTEDTEIVFTYEEAGFPTITLQCVKAEDNTVVLETYNVPVDPITGAYNVYDVLPYELLDTDGVHYSWTSELRWFGVSAGSGTVNKGDKDGEFTAVYAVDVLIDPTVPEEDRPAGGGDGIPDDCQLAVNYVAINGTVTPSQTAVTKYIEYEGNFCPSQMGEAKLSQAHLPTAAPNPGFTNGTWDTEPVAGMVIENNVTFTITYEPIVIPGNRVITINRTENGVVLNSVSVTVPQGNGYTVTSTDAPDSFDLGGNHYVRTSARPTVPAGNDNVTVSVSYAIDNIGGGADGRGPDGIPDNQEAVVYYTSNNEVYGTVANAYQTFNLGSANASSTVTLSNTASTTAMSRTYFSNWMQGRNVLSSGATLNVDFAVVGGSTYEVVAIFGRSSGGGSTGGGSTGGGSTGGGNTGGGDTTIVDNEVPLAGDTQLNKEDHFAYVSGYEDGTVRPNNNITREEVAAIFYRLLTDESRAIYDTDVNDFSDVTASRWSNRAISTLSNAGIISGYPDGTFRPGQTITRAEFAAIAAQFDVVTENVENPFSDTTGHWAENLISYAASKGWVSGYTDGTFLPQKAITRAEAMTLINNVLDREVDEEGLLAEAKQWPDNQKDSWYYYEVLEATNSHDYTRRSEGNLVENWTAITNQ